MTAPSQTPEAAGLEPCPFCGGEAWLNDYEAKYSDLPPKSRAPQCRSCGASLGYLTTPAKATEAWNRRVTAASAQAAIDAEKARADRLGEIASKLDAAIGWLDYPFIDNRTPEAELRQRVGFMIKDAEPHRAALQQETQP